MNIIWNEVYKSFKTLFRPPLFLSISITTSVSVNIVLGLKSKVYQSRLDREHFIIIREEKTL